MAYIPSFEENLAYLEGADLPGPVTLTGSSGGTGTPVSGPGVSQNTTTASSGAAVEQQPSQFIQNTGSLKERLFAPVETGILQGRNTLGGLESAFQASAGPAPQYNQSVLEQAIATGSPSDIGGAQNVLGTQYTGPQSLDADATSSLQNYLEGLRSRSQATMQGGALQTLIQQSSPGVTPGEARYEAKGLLREPGYRQQSQNYQSSIDQLFQDLAKKEAEAQTLAGQRATEAEAVRNAARNYLTGRRADTEGAISQQMDQAQVEQQAIRDAFARYQNTGDINALEPTGFDTAQFNTPIAQRTQEASRLYDQILSEFADLQGKPTLGLGISDHGKETLVTPEGRSLATQYVAHGDITPEERRLVERQIALRDLFRPGQEGAEFSDVLPSQFAGSKEEAIFKSPDTRPFVRAIGLERTPTMANVSTEEQKNTINRVNEILGSLDRIDNVDPFQAATIAADLDGFISEEEQALRQHKESTDKEMKDWANFVHGVRKRYRKAKRRSNWAKIISMSTAAGVLL